MLQDCSNKTPAIQPQDISRIHNLLAEYGWLGNREQA